MYPFNLSFWMFYFTVWVPKFGALRSIWSAFVFMTTFILTVVVCYTSCERPVLARVYFSHAVLSVLRLPYVHVSVSVSLCVCVCALVHRCLLYLAFFLITIEWTVIYESIKLVTFNFATIHHNKWEYHWVLCWLWIYKCRGVSVTTSLDE